MTMITNVVPFRFYQVRPNDEGMTINDIGIRFDVAPEKVKRDNADPHAPLTPGEMLFIQYS